MSAINEMLVKGIAPPDNPNTRLQKYRLTPEDEKALTERGGEDGK